MTAKEQKAFMELGQTLGDEGEDLSKYVAQCIEAERAQKEADRALEREKATAKNEAKKAKIEADRETEKAKIEAAKEAEKVNGGMKTLKLPTFNEDKDDLDAYLNRFERACQAYAVTPEN